MQPPEQFVLRQLKYHPLPAGDRFQGLYLEGLGHIYSIIIYVSTIFRYFMLFQLFFLQNWNWNQNEISARRSDSHIMGRIIP